MERNRDFDVTYRFLTPEEGGRKTGPPRQGYKCDWFYEGDKPFTAWMIWPEFMDEHGVPLRKGTVVPIEGNARMWILSERLREEVHRKRIHLGVKGYFVEGSRRVAEATVVRVVGIDEPFSRVGPEGCVFAQDDVVE